ncbi:MAG TPA: hypothetical protein VGM08_02305 [Candidatus Saccharimonadales bacterium]|jgi:hypothetical protein
MQNTLAIHEPKLSGTMLICTYSFGSETFTSKYTLPHPVQASTDPLTIKLCQWVALSGGFGLFSVEYFDEIVCDFGLTADEVAFFEKILFMGLGEFRLVNNIPLDKHTTVRGIGTPIIVSADAPKGKHGTLLLNGGGKDGSVSAYLLQQAGISFTWFQRGESVAQRNVAEAWDAPVVKVMRELDPNRQNRKYAGHRPTSAGIAMVAVLAAHLFGYTEIVASNEASANEGNLTHEGFTVNHQYSKSLEFERDLQTLLRTFHTNIDYFSLLRPLYELQIAQLTPYLNDKQLAAITSCNHGTKKGYWCLACAKCAFVILAVTASSVKTAEKIWENPAVINTSTLRPYLVELLDPDVTKPLECVGTLAECQLAAHLILEQYPDLLDGQTRKLFEKYAALRDADQDDTILRYRGPSAMPEHFRSALPDHL